MAGVLGMSKADCAFCGIARRERPADIVYETESALAFLPLRPAAVGHTLVIPKAHVRDFLTCPAPLAGELARVVGHLGCAVRDAVAAEGMNVVISAGAAATQTVFHLHVHLVPRWTGDALGDFWPLNPPEAIHVRADVADRIRRCAHLISSAS